jgi:hypothetical protein
MTEDRSSTLVLKDEAGAYYVLTPEVLAQAKATREQQAAIEAALAGADTQGFRYENIGGNLAGPIILNRVTPSATIPVYNDLAVPVINERW